MAIKTNLHIKVKCDLMASFICQTNIEWLSYANHTLGPKDTSGDKTKQNKDPRICRASTFFSVRP